MRKWLITKMHKQNVQMLLQTLWQVPGNPLIFNSIPSKLQGYLQIGPCLDAPDQHDTK